MKKIYLFLFLLVFMGGGVKSQVNLPEVNPQPLNQNFSINPIKKRNLKTVSCTDTVAYPASKLTGIAEIDTMDLSTYISGVSQAFYFSGSGTIDGINAYVFLDTDGVAGNASPIIMTIKVYDIDGGNYPTTIIDSADVQVIDVGFVPQALLFSSPINISDSFAVSLELNTSSPANPYYVTNTSANSDGNGEKLSCAKYLGVWYNAFDDFGGWDMDVMLEPIFNTTITSNYTTDKDTIYPNDTVVFTNTSTNITDVMFNLYNTTTSPLYTWNFDDGTGTYNPFDTSYVFANPGDYNTQLTANYYGYTLNCMDTDSKPVHVNFALALEEEVGAKKVSVYPIPANKYFNVSVPNKYLGGEIIVTDVVGKKMLSKQIQNESKVKMTTENLASGIYFVSIASQGERVYTQRIVVDK